MLMENCKLAILLSVAIFLMTSCAPRFVQIRRAELLYKKGQVHLSKGEEAKAIIQFEESLSLAMEAGFNTGVAHNLNEIAIIHTSRGEYVKARDALARAIKIYGAANMKSEVSKSLNNMAVTYVREQDFKEAINRYEELLRWDRKTNNDLGMAITLNNMGIIYEHHLREHEEAQRRYSEALKIFRELGNKKYIKAVEKNMF